jgi:hypothetical protein
VVVAPSGRSSARSFRFVNGLPDGWRPVFHAFQLLGVLGAPLVVAAVAPSSDVP